MSVAYFVASAHVHDQLFEASGFPCMQASDRAMCDHADFSNFDDDSINWKDILDESFETDTDHEENTEEYVSGAHDDGDMAMAQWRCRS